MEAFRLNRKYVAIKNYSNKVPCLPLDSVKDREIVTYIGQNLGFAKFKKGDGSIITINAITAFKLFEEI